MKKILSFALAAVMLFTAALSVSAFPVWRGDADGNEIINVSDAVLILKKIAGWDVTVADSADYNSDGKVNVSDVVYVLKYIAGWDVLNDDLLEAKYGVHEVSFEIPDPVTDKTVPGSEFGFDTEAEDNTPAFAAAAAYLRENPGTTVLIDTGVYRMNPASTVTFSSVKNCIVDGQGSTFIYKNGRYFSVSGCENFKICGITVDWDWEYSRLASVVRIKSIADTPNGAGRYDVEYEFVFEEDASFALTQTWDSMIFLDPETLSPGLFGYGDLFSLETNTYNRRLTDKNVITASVGLTSLPPNGAYALLRHYNYGNAVFSISGGSTGIVVDGVTIHGVPGSGCIMSGGVSHVRLSDFTIGLNPETADRHKVSTTADAIHIKDTHGYFILDNCDISYNYDDCLNIHDNVGVVEDAYDNVLEMHTTNTTAFNVGDELGFRSGTDYTWVDFTAVITARSASGMDYVLTLDRDCEDELEEGMVVTDNSLDSGNYIIRNSYFHENRARGLLLGSSNCLVENNRFYAIQQGAINIPVDITTDMWDEGKGAENIIIRNNVFDHCNTANISGSSAIQFVTNNSFNPAGALCGPCFENVLISGNRFVDPVAYIMSVISVDNLTFFGNTVEFTRDTHPKDTQDLRGQIKVNGTYYANSRIINNTWIKADFVPDTFNKISVQKSKMTMEISGNVVK